jgi:RimJ/RimL family protein N-acetyltransferase
MDWFTINPKLMRYLTDIAAWPATGQAVSPRLASLIFRPVQAEDVDLIVEMHQRSSERTIYSRYHSPRVPTRQEIAQICQLNGENGRAIVAAIGGKNPAVVGLAYYMLSAPDTAEPALMVEDRYQGQGIGKHLLHQLTAQAIAQGICVFEAFVLPTNKPMLHLLHQTGQVVQNKLVYGAREMRIQLTAVRPWAFADEWLLIKEPARLTI